VIPAKERDGDGEEVSAKEWILLQALRLRNVKEGMGEDEKRRLWVESGRGS